MMRTGFSRLNGGWRQALPVVLIGASLALAGCNSSSNNNDPDDPIIDPITEAAAKIAQVSAEDYRDNRNGLITGDTLANWMADWTTNRPAGIEGDLVILQIAPGPEDAAYLRSSDPGVRTHALAVGQNLQATRGNNVIVTRSMVADGEQMDATLNRYGIDPTRDMVVCAPGNSAVPSNVFNAGRCWFTLRYWGMSAEQLAILDGGNNVQIDLGMMNADHFALAPAAPPEDGTASVRDLQEDNFALLATLDDMVALIDGERVPEKGALLWDARGEAEYLGAPFSSSPMGLVTPENGCVGPADRPGRCAPAIEGTLHGAVRGTFTELLQPDGRYLSKGELANYMANMGYQEGQVVYTFCRTSARGMVPLIASGVILGNPTKVYDGATTQWHSLAHHMNADGGFNLPADSHWRNDSPARTGNLNFNPSDSVEPAMIQDAMAVTADGILREDRAYRGLD